MNGESKQQKNQDQYTQQEGTEKAEQNKKTGYGDKKLEGPDIPST
ncbi:hypothetical protein [Fictibacillus nanhaiensis]|nr:hypothetical protein [Fictibacillus nanhaiensis]